MIHKCIDGTTILVSEISAVLPIMITSTECSYGILMKSNSIPVSIKYPTTNMMHVNIAIYGESVLIEGDTEARKLQIPEGDTFPDMIVATLIDDFVHLISSSPEVISVSDVKSFVADSEKHSLLYQSFKSTKMVSVTGKAMTEDREKLISCVNDLYTIKNN